MKSKQTRFFKYTTLAMALFASFAVAGSLQTDNSFTIKAQSLDAALAQFSMQSDTMVVAPQELLAGKRAPDVNGTMSNADALNTLLQGSGLKYAETKDGQLVIQEDASSQVQKQSASGKNEGKNRIIEEIIVTATKREQSLQDIPMSINAFTGDRVEAVSDMLDMQFLAAGLNITKDPYGAVVPTIRGIGSTLFTVGTESGVAAHRDGVFLGLRQDVGLGFFDIERVEVLRGPQGTLYGRNATGGAINVITKAPTSEFRTGGTVSVGNYDLFDVTGYVSGPLANGLSGRVALKKRKNDGYTPNVFNGERYDNDDYTVIRTKLRYEPTGTLKINLSADYADDDSYSAIIPERGRAGAPLPHETAGFSLPNGRAVNKNDDSFRSQQMWGVDARIEWELPDVRLVSLTSYREAKIRQAVDLDHGALSILPYSISSDYKQASQEFTLASLGGSDFDWIVGGYYFHSDSSTSSRALVPALSIDSRTKIPELLDDALAVFGEASYHMSDRLTLTLGARYSYEEKSIEQNRTALTSGVVTTNTSTPLQDEWRSFTPKIAITYALSDEVTTYATISQGFKAGGFNGGSAKLSFDPEEVTNYEVGLKSSFYENRLKTNISLFYMDYADQQVLVQSINPVTGGAINDVTNAATSIIRGVELEFQAEVTEQLSLDGNISYLDAVFDEWTNALDIGGSGVPTDVSGNQMPNAPKWAANIGVNYTIPAGSWGTATLRGEWSHKTRTYFSAFELPIISQEAYSLLNARVTFEGVEGKWRVTAFANNLTDELVATRRDEGSALTGRGVLPIYLPPRTYGISVGYDF